MKSFVLTIYLAFGLLISVIIFISSYTQSYRLPGNHEGYEPVQPIAFSHRLHAGELGIACLHCHTSAERSKNAGIPSTNTCMNCHRFISAPILDVRAEEEQATEENRQPERVVSPEIRKIYEAMGLNDELQQDAGRQSSPIEWIKVHTLPDYVYFNHSAHVNAGVACQTCHGEVQTMERVRQVNDLSMGWCVNCHRDPKLQGPQMRPVKASTDCATCHY
jgi:hypothetical protein